MICHEINQSKPYWIFLTCYPIPDWFYAWLILYSFFSSFVHRNWWGLSDQPYDWGWHVWVCRWLIRPICVWKGSRAARTRNGGCSGWCGCAFSKFLQVLQTFTLHLTISCHLFLFCTRYSWQLGAILKDFMETVRVSLKHFFWSPWEFLPWDSSPKSSYFGKRWPFMWTTWLAQQSYDCIKRV